VVTLFLYIYICSGSHLISVSQAGQALFMTLGIPTLYLGKAIYVGMAWDLNSLLGYSVK